MSSEPYVPSEVVVKRAYVDAHLRDDRGGIPEEVSEPEFDRFIAKVRADALREAAESLPAPVGLKCNAACHDADRIHLRIRANRIEEEA